MLREAFVQPAQLARGYHFAFVVTGGSCSTSQFANLIRNADRRGVWSFVGLRIWAVPFVLVTLDDFVSPRGIAFRLVMGRRRTAPRSFAWKGMETGVLRKYFADSGNRFSRGAYAELAVNRREFDRATARPSSSAAAFEQSTSALQAAVAKLNHRHR